MQKVELIILETVDEYKKEFVGYYLDPSKTFVLGDIPVVLVKQDFDHIFSEPLEGGGWQVPLKLDTESIPAVS